MQLILEWLFNEIYYILHTKFERFYLNLLEPGLIYK